MESSQESCCLLTGCRNLVDCVDWSTGNLIKLWGYISLCYWLHLRKNVQNMYANLNLHWVQLVSHIFLHRSSHLYVEWRKSQIWSASCKHRPSLSVHFGQPWWLSLMRVWLVIRRLLLDPHRVGNILSLRFDHEIFSTVILSLLLIQEGQLSVSGERLCTILVNHLED